MNVWNEDVQFIVGFSIVGFSPVCEKIWTCVLLCCTDRSELSEAWNTTSGPYTSQLISGMNINKQKQSVKISNKDLLLKYEWNGEGRKYALFFHLTYSIRKQVSLNYRHQHPQGRGTNFQPTVNIYYSIHYYNTCTYVWLDICVKSLCRHACVLLFNYAHTVCINE